MSQWFCIRVVTQRADKVAVSLAEHPRGFSTFSPQERVNRKIGRHVVQHDRPMFPGYLFVLCCPDADDFSAVRSVSGVLEFVRVMEAGVLTPIAFPTLAILKIQAEERAGKYDRTRAKPNAYQPRKGDRVQITAGPWIAFIAKVLSTPRGKRANVMIEGPFGRGESIEVAHLKAA